ncbi:hypothetical protein J1614_002278 [Plenodomus biglobosus]|nr:hypothetical protein J1614_002278 [Plenodomus biglobosus]
MRSTARSSMLHADTAHSAHIASMAAQSTEAIKSGPGGRLCYKYDAPLIPILLKENVLPNPEPGT